jgi:hypothetical protein
LERESSFFSSSWIFGLSHCGLFQWQKLLKNQYLPHFESKSYQINSIKSCSSSKIFPTTPKAHSNSSEIFSYDLIWFDLIFSEEIIRYSKTFAPQVQTSWNPSPCTSLLVESFPKNPKNMIGRSIPVGWIS